MKTTFWACASVGSCIGGFVVSALPYLQATALVVSIAAGLVAIFRKKK